MTQPAITERSSLLELLHARRSAGDLHAPGPTPAQLAHMLRAAGTVPDHGRLRPFRFAIVEGDGRAAFGDALANTAAEQRPGTPSGALDKMRSKAFRSPTSIVLIASTKPGKIEVWEQRATAACAGYAIMLAAYALGVGAVWKSVPFTRGTALSELFRMTEAEEMLGWIHLGTEHDAETAARPELDLAAATIMVDGAGVSPYRPA